MIPTDYLANDLGPVFALTQGGDLFIPYGEWRHAAGLQRFGPEEGRALAENFAAAHGRTLLDRLRGAGVPVYIGHPDLPARRAEFPDQRAYGWLSAVTPENDGVRLAVKWSRAGRELIEEGAYRYHSPLWAAQRDSGVLRPVELISIGLTNQPNIPVPPIANESEPEPITTDTMQKLNALLSLADDAGEDDILAAVQARLDRIAELEAAAENADTDPDPDPAEEEEEKKEDEPTPAENAARLETRLRESRVDAALDALVIGARLAVADRPAARERLLACENDADYQSALAAYADAAPVLKTAATTAGAAAAAGQLAVENEADTRRRRRDELITEIRAEKGCDFPTAAQLAARREPALFT